MLIASIILYHWPEQRKEGDITDLIISMPFEMLKSQVLMDKSKNGTLLKVNEEEKKLKALSLRFGLEIPSV
jgi:hypothetical protein